MIEVAKKIIQNNKEIKFDIDNIAYEDLQGIARLLGWGVIVESGENENGEYIKFGNGRMVCQAYIEFDNIGVTSSWGSLYMSGNISWQYPEPFVGRPFASANDNITAQPVFEIPVTVSTSVYLFKLASAQSFSSRSRQISLFAIGRWK